MRPTPPDNSSEHPGVGNKPSYQPEHNTHPGTERSSAPASSPKTEPAAYPKAAHPKAAPVPSSKAEPAYHTKPESTPHLKPEALSHSKAEPARHTLNTNLPKTKAENPSAPNTTTGAPGRTTGTPGMATGTPSRTGRRTRRTINKPKRKKAPIPVSNRPQHTSFKTGIHWAQKLLVAVIAVILFGVSASASAFVSLQNHLKTLENTQSLVNKGTKNEKTPAIPPDFAPGKPLNIMVIGSDSRSGANDVDGAGKEGEVTGARSDTTMVVHISADRTHVDIVSIPRDLLTDRPICYLSDGRSLAGEPDAMFNTAFAMGGNYNDIAAAAACAIRTFQNFSGITIDDFVVVDFSGIIHVVDALGGVPMYVPFNVDDVASGIKLSQGCHVFTGTEAIGWARARKSLGDGSDIGRIARQQQIVSAIAREALNSGYLANPTNAYGFLSAALDSLQTGPVIGKLSNLLGIAASIRNLKIQNIHMMTMPFVYAGNRVREAADAANVWADIRADRPINAALTGTGNPPANTGDSLLDAREIWEKTQKNPANSGSGNSSTTPGSENHDGTNSANSHPGDENQKPHGATPAKPTQADSNSESSLANTDTAGVKNGRLPVCKK